IFIIIILLICISIFYWISAIRYEKSRKELIFSLHDVFDKYRFLMKQLVNRDFKVRYKSSVLGMFWSVLNPLLTALIQYIVFSQVFKADIENFPVYLLSGTIIFNFFNEAISLSLISIVGNANLITKVYVPKYIYPVSKILSSVINFILSLIPLVIIMMITGEKITKAFLLFPIFFINVLFFTIGIGLFLSTLMVFFRDIQFLWSVVSLMWMYLTPLFYPADIFPKQFAWILKYNPMYYFIDATRTIIMNGVSPEPKIYLQCFIFSIVSLVLGVIFFNKKQDKFIFYI
ncbi:MAG: ABC transporter permease, partial [Clostridiales bacterium]|nr:ABC transporter permease [Clostridiales bacterium]